MFRTLPDIERPATVPLEQLIPLSVLALDLPVPGDGWSAHLAGRGIEISTDDLGRLSVSRSDARRLFDEHREHEERKAELLRAADEAAEEYDRARRAQIWKGVSADAIPRGVRAGDAMIAAARQAQPKRQSPLEEALSNSPEMAYHAYPANPDEE
jgi:hypothetical protein